MEGVQVVGNSRCSIAFCEQYSLQVLLEHNFMQSHVVSTHCLYVETTCWAADICVIPFGM